MSNLQQNIKLNPWIIKTETTKKIILANKKKFYCSLPTNFFAFFLSWITDREVFKYKENTWEDYRTVT